jgi:hypothetical protein
VISGAGLTALYVVLLIIAAWAAHGWAETWHDDEEEEESDDKSQDNGI